MSEFSRLRDEYVDRTRRLHHQKYSLFDPVNLFFVQSRQQAILKALRIHGFFDLSKSTIMEMGCGKGGVLKEFLFFGAIPIHLFGIDLLQDRILSAKKQLSESHFANANGQFLPFTSGAFDLVMQYTAISSILDPELRYAICRDMVRVTRPGGLILSYDFWLNPTNKQTLGLRPSEIKKAFFDCTIEFKKITLAPPLARLLVPLSWGFAYFMETLGIFNSHYLAIIKPNPNVDGPKND